MGSASRSPRTTARRGRPRASRPSRTRRSALTLTGSDPTGSRSRSSSPRSRRAACCSGTAPALTYTPAPDANGTDSFTFTANDGNDQSLPATVTIAVTPVNDPPVPQPDTVTARAGAGGDGHRPPRSPRNDDAGPFDEAAQIADRHRGDRQGRTRTAPSYWPTGNVTYTPDPGFIGTAVIAYTVCDDGTTDWCSRTRCARTPRCRSRRTGHRSANAQSAQTSLTAPVAIVLGATDPDGDAADLRRRLPARPTAPSPAPPRTSPTRRARRLRRRRPVHVHRRRRLRAVGAGDGDDHGRRRAGADARRRLRRRFAPVGRSTSTSSPTTRRAAARSPCPAFGDRRTGDARAPPSRSSTDASGTPRPPGPAGRTRSRTPCATPAAAAHGDRHRHDQREHHPGRRRRHLRHRRRRLASARRARACSANDVDPDTGDVLQAHLVTGVGNGRLLLNGNGSFTYVPNGPGIDTFTYRVVDASGAVSNVATVTIYVTGPSGPPIVGNDLFEVQRGRELVIAAPGVLTNDTSPNPRLGLTVRAATRHRQGRAASATRRLVRLHPGRPATPGIDQFSYTVRDSEGRVSARRTSASPSRPAARRRRRSAPPRRTTGSVDPRADDVHRHPARPRPARP